MDNKEAVNVPIAPDAAWERRLRLWVDDPSKSRGGVSNENADAEMAECRTMVVAVDHMMAISIIGSGNDSTGRKQNVTEDMQAGRAW